MVVLFNTSTTSFISYHKNDSIFEARFIFPTQFNENLFLLEQGFSFLHTIFLCNQVVVMTKIRPSDLGPHHMEPYGPFELRKRERERERE